MATKIETILYASDLKSFDAKEVFETAVAHCMAHKAKLVFLNVIEPIDQSTVVYLSSYLSDSQISNICADQEGLVREEIQNRITMFCEEELKGNSDLCSSQVSIEVVTGRPSEKIIEVASSVNADMIVMGTRVNSRLGGVFHHSVAHDVTLHAKCPVLIQHIK